ncbi:MAG: hypothetical protein MUD12_01930 [Spirochaetes bacterium]|nr:hypothetical protein [Spirochaetota bacterium]
MPRLARLLFLIATTISFLHLGIEAYGLESRKEYFYRPQVGAWFGPITPVGKTGEKIDAALAGGFFVRINTPYKPMKIAVDVSYQHFKSKQVNELYCVPLYGNLVYLLPVNLPIKIQLKGGMGSGYVSLRPDRIHQWDALFMTGMEVSFPAGRIINIGIRLDYLYLYDGNIESRRNYVFYIKKPISGGHILNTGITLYFNI